MARARGTRGSSNVGPASAMAAWNSSAAVAGSAASSHCSPARMWASARDMFSGAAWTGSVACTARRLMRTAARLWLPVRAALTSIASNSSPKSTTTSPNLPAEASNNPGLFPFYRLLLPAGALERVPEATAQRVPDLIVQQVVDRQRRSLQQPGLQVGRHPRLAGQHRFQPQRRSVPRHRGAELLTLLVRGLHGLGQRHSAARGPAGRHSASRHSAG